MIPDKECLAHFFNSLNNREMTDLGNLLNEDTIFYFPKTSPLLGKSKILKFFKILFKQYPVLLFEIKKNIIQDNMAAVHWTNNGLTRKNEAYENEGVTLLEYKEDKIVFISDFFKNTEKF